MSPPPRSSITEEPSRRASSIGAHSGTFGVVSIGSRVDCESERVTVPVQRLSEYPGTSPFHAVTLDSIVSSS